MKIGIPRGMFFYRYQTLLLTFFSELDIDYIISDLSTKKTLEDGKFLAPSEGCTSLKLFLGHIKNLENRCDFILVPRIRSVKKDEKVCTNFFGVYDLVNNLSSSNIIYFNIDEGKKKTERIAFLELGLYLGFSYNDTVTAYERAKVKNKKVSNNKILKQTDVLNNCNKKILLAGHPYVLYDDYLGQQIIDILKENNIDIVYSDIYDSRDLEDEIRDISLENYFTFNKEIMGAISKYKNNINGIILVSCFPCGPDSLCNELIIRKIKNVPIINVILDEQTSQTGLTTRLESFLDIINKENIYD